MCRRQYRHRKAMSVPKQTTGVPTPDAKGMDRHGAPQSHKNQAWKPGVTKHTWKPNTQEVEAGGQWVPDQPGLRNETLSQETRSIYCKESNPA